jgi:two-component sensor histidine kinase
MTPIQKYSFQKLFHNYVAKVNHLDTLIELRNLMETFYLDRIAAGHKEELYVKDQQFEVSKTKNVLEYTASQLDITKKVLIISTIALTVFALLVAYLFYLFRKNRNLSRRNELLIKEQNHRVKNSLQMINSLLYLQSQKLPSADARDALEKSQNRINSVALLHRMLYEGEHAGEVEFTTYLRSLVEEIRYSTGRELEIDLNLPSTLQLKVEKVTSLGLIVNELLTNSIKHVEKSIALCVRIHLTIADSKIHFAYRDNGLGVTQEVWKSAESFGNQLIQIQSKQLGGEFGIYSEGGFRYDLNVSV